MAQLVSRLAMDWTVHKKRLYAAVLTNIRVAAGSPEMRIQKLWPNTDWTRIWKNLKEAPVSDNTRCTWYRVLHDVTPTNARLYRIKMTPSISCQRCTMDDRLEHRLTECGEGRNIWQYTKTRIALILRTIPSRIPDEWILRPQFNIWPTRLNNAVLWLIASVTFRLHQRTTLTLSDFMDFLLRARWKLLNHTRCRNLVGNYLTVIDYNK